jgi:hypothetical protein
MNFASIVSLITTALALEKDIEASGIPADAKAIEPEVLDVINSAKALKTKISADPTLLAEGSQLLGHIKSLFGIK